MISTVHSEISSNTDPVYYTETKVVVSGDAEFLCDMDACREHSLSIP